MRGNSYHPLSVVHWFTDGSSRYPTVTRVRRTVSYTRPPALKQRTVERRIYW